MSRCVTVVTGIIGAIVSIFCASAMAAESGQDFLGLITGEAKSTAHQIGMDLKAVAKQANIHLAVYNSMGAVENIYAVYQRPGNHIGLVQSDVLAFVAKVDTDPQLRVIADKIKWIYPLYDQEVHILAKTDIRGFDDLKGRRVAIGDEENGSYLTSRLMFEISGVLPRHMAAIGGEKALAALKSGTIDAMVIIDGLPVEWLALDVSVMDGLHLLSVTHEGVRAFYPASRIPSGTYPWQTADVETISVRAILVAYDFRNSHCRTIGKLARMIGDHLDWLRFNGHPKWKTVNLENSVDGWERYSCVTNYTPDEDSGVAEDAPDRKPNPVADAIKAVFRP